MMNLINKKLIELGVVLGETKSNIEAMRERIAELEKENRKMKEALEFYSKKDYYINDTGYGYSVIDNDIGKKAREALKEDK